MGSCLQCLQRPASSALNESSSDNTLSVSALLKLTLQSRIHVCPPLSPIHLFPLTPSHQLGQTMMTDPALPHREGSIGSVRLYFSRPFRQRMPHNQVGLALVYLVMPLNQRPPL